MKIRLDGDGEFRREDGALLVGIDGLYSWRHGDGRRCPARLINGAWCVAVQGSNGREFRTLECLDDGRLTWWMPDGGTPCAETK